MAANATKKKETRYVYTARNSRGETTRGEITSTSESAAAKRLQMMGLAPLTVKPQTAAGGLGQMKIGRGKRVKAKHLAMFARQFTTMIDAGLPLVRTVQALTEQTDHPQLREVLPDVQDHLERGNSFSSALARHPKVFPPLMVGMVAAGEVSGSLAEAMNTVAETYRKEAELRSKTISAMLYPGIVLGMAVVIVTGMLLFVVPRFATIFSQLGGQLPFMTRMLVAVSKQMLWLVPTVLVAGFAWSVWWRKHKNDRRVREVVDPVKFRVPIMGGFFQKIALARFARTFSSLLAAGVGLPQTLDIVGTTSGSIIIGDAVAGIRKAVIAGDPIASQMGEHEIFPPLVVQMVTTGEEAGALPEMLRKVADFYEQEVSTMADSLSSILEPIMIALLAGVIGAIVFALYMPIFSVFDLVG